MRDMEWNVYVSDFSGKHIVAFNVFDYDCFLNDVKKIYKKHKDDFVLFSKELKKSLLYYFWCKCEWEVIISAWPPRVSFEEKKVDVYNQVMLNWDIFVRYVWDMAHLRKTSKKGDDADE